MIHSTAKVSQGAKIAKDVHIGAYCTIAEDVILGSGVVLEPHVTIKSKVALEKGSHIHAFAQLGNGQTPIILKQHCTVREFSHIGTKSTSGNTITIDEHCYIMAYVEIHAGVHLERNCIITNNVILGEGSHCHANVIVAAKASVDKGCTIGERTMIGGASHVRGDIPPYCLAEGYPEAVIRGLNLVGMRRGFEDRKSITEVKKVFHYLRKSHFSSAEAKSLLNTLEDAHAIRFAAFVSRQTIRI